MQETIYDPKTGLHYKLIGDYYIPLVKAPDPPQIGIWGHRRKHHRRPKSRRPYGMGRPHEQ